MQDNRYLKLTKLVDSSKLKQAKVIHNICAVFGAEQIEQVGYESPTCSGH